MKRALVPIGLVLMTVAALAQTQPAKSGSGRRPPVAAPNGTLLIGINDMVGRIAEPGWPLIVGATKYPDDNATVTLPAAFTLRLTTTSGTAVDIRFEAVPPLANESTSYHWLVSESATTQLSPGSYRVSAVAGQPQLTGWRVEPGEFKIVAPDPERKGLLNHLRIQRFMILGKTDDALAAAEQLTRDNANDADAWIVKGDIHMTMDQPDNALAAYERALKLQENSGREPIAIMSRQRKAFQRSLEKRGVLTPR